MGLESKKEQRATRFSLHPCGVLLCYIKYSTSLYDVLFYITFGHLCATTQQQ